MRIRMKAVAIGLAIGVSGSGAITSSSAAVVCKKKSGALFVRDACRKKETVVDLAGSGAVGPKGDKGDKGDPGDPATIPSLPAVQSIATFENGWHDYGLANNPAGFYKDAFGIVHLTGAIAGGTPPSYAFTLPAGYQVVGTFASGSVNNSTNTSVACTLFFFGADVYVEGGCNGGLVGLDGITFRPR